MPSILRQPSSSATSISIPNLLENWPWKRRVNPHLSECKAKTEVWIRSFDIFSPETQAAFDKCAFSRTAPFTPQRKEAHLMTGLLGCLAYPDFDQEGAQLVCDLMTLFFFIDGVTDIGDGETVQRQVDIMMHALYNPTVSRPPGEWIGGEIARQFGESGVNICDAVTRKNFLSSFHLYLEGVVKEALDRENKSVRDIEDYFNLRRQTIGVTPCFALLTMKMDIPSDILNHPTLEALRVACTDLILIANDIYSYNVEQARGGDRHNLVTVIMQEHSCSIVEAIDWMTKRNGAVVESVHSLMKVLPLSGEPELDDQIMTYANGLAGWVTANGVWSFESERYFGKKGLEVRKGKTVELLPKTQIQIG